MVLINVLWHTLAAHLMQFNVACCVIIGSDALCWSISSYLCLWVTGFYSAGLWCRLTGWRYNRIYITEERSPQRSDWLTELPVYLFKTLCGLVVGVSSSPPLGCHNWGGAWHLCRRWRGGKKAAGTGIFTTLPSRRLYPRLLSSSGGIFF